MTDEAIDTSDVPPLTDSFFAEAKWRLPRLYMDRLDMLEAIKFAARIVKKEWHGRKKTELQRLDHLAYNTSLIVSYSRPFHNNRNFEGEPRSSLKDVVDRVLDQSEAELHNKVLQMRDTAYAHSDARTHRIKGLNYQKSVPLLMDPEPLNKSDTKTLIIMIRKWIRYLNEEISHLN